MVRSLIKSIAKVSREHEFTYRYGNNLPATLGYRMHRPPLAPSAQRVVHQLRRDGIAITDVTDLLGECPQYIELMDAVEKLEQQQAEALAADRAEASRPALPHQRKPYVRYLLDDPPLLDLESPFVKFALQPTILRITNAYFGMLTRLAYFNVWHTFVTDAEPQSSQLWHRDFDDPHYIMKVFLYLTDVDSGSGPLSYAPGSHSHGSMSREPDCVEQHSNSRRSSDQQMADVIPRDRWKEAVGPKGTLVFAAAGQNQASGLSIPACSPRRRCNSVAAVSSLRVPMIFACRTIEKWPPHSSRAPKPAS